MERIIRLRSHKQSESSVSFEVTFIWLESFLCFLKSLLKPLLQTVLSWWLVQLVACCWEVVKRSSMNFGFYHLVHLNCWVASLLGGDWSIWMFIGQTVNWVYLMCFVFLSLTNWSWRRWPFTLSSSFPSVDSILNLRYFLIESIRIIGQLRGCLFRLSIASLLFN